MREIVIEKNEAGQRLDKFLAKYMNEASKSFFYKMMRKKNITLNGKKCEERKLAEGDVVKLFLAEDTIEKFSSVQVQEVKKVDLDILYEDVRSFWSTNRRVCCRRRLRRPMSLWWSI